jgi:hypothetical protein
MALRNCRGRHTIYARHFAARLYSPDLLIEPVQAGAPIALALYYLLSCIDACRATVSLTGVDLHNMRMIYPYEKLNSFLGCRFDSHTLCFR